MGKILCVKKYLFANPVTIALLTDKGKMASFNSQARPKDNITKEI